MIIGNITEYIVCVQQWAKHVKFGFVCFHLILPICYSSFTEGESLSLRKVTCLKSHSKSVGQDQKSRQTDSRDCKFKEIRMPH